MNNYHKIQTVYKRDPETKHKTLLEGSFSLPEFEYLAENKWQWQEKIDGANTRAMFDGELILFGGRTDNAQISAFLANRLNEIFLPQLELFRTMFPDGKVCLYGEGYGAKIQKGGGNYRQDQDFVLFDIKIGDWWLLRPDVEDIAQKLSLDIVPVIGSGTLFEMVAKVKEGFNSQWGDFIAEGIVARPLVELKTRRGDRLITKVKCKDFR